MRGNYVKNKILALDSEPCYTVYSSILLPFPNMKHSTKFWLQINIIISVIVIASFYFGFVVGQNVPTHDMPTTTQNESN